MPFLENLSDEARNIGACNTLCLTPQGWLGTNTDARGFSDSLLAFLNIPSFKRKRITVIGAGGAARAVVFELHRLGAKVLILNRTALKARRLAAPYKFAWGGLDERKIEMVDKYHDIIIQTTSVGMEGTETEEYAGPKDTMDTKDPTGLRDPLAMYNI
jgi:3-dehydroquinate dehydratase/shikimate dehydrogenase